MRRQTDDTLHFGYRGLRTRGGGAPRMVAGGLVLGLASFSVAVLPAQVAGAATDTVTTCSGSAALPGSLPYEVQNAVSGDTVNFSVSCPPSSPIVLAGTIDIAVDLTIAGPGSTTLAVSGNKTVGVFAVPSGITATISGITVEDGLSDGGSGIDNSGTLIVSASTLFNNNSSAGGGGVLNEDGTLNVTDSTLRDNSAYHGGGGGIDNDGGSATVADSTLSDNGAFYGGAAIGGGGIENTSGTLAVTDSTFSHNSSDYNVGGGGALLNDTGTADVTESTLSENRTSKHGAGDITNEAGTVSVAGTVVATGGSEGDCSGSVTDAGYNLDDDGSCGFSGVDHSQSDVDAYLGPLQDNGGPTDTQAPAIDGPELNQIPPGATANSTTLCPGTDQRGISRPQGPKCDIGAVEVAPMPQTITSADSATGTVGKSFSFTVRTTGSPVPSITKSGRFPKGLVFFDTARGTATLKGKPKTAGTSHVVIKATFGTHVVTQAFTVVINP